LAIAILNRPHIRTRREHARAPNLAAQFADQRTEWRPVSLRQAIHPLLDIENYPVGVIQSAGGPLPVTRFRFGFGDVNQSKADFAVGFHRSTDIRSDDPGPVARDITPFASLQARFDFMTNSAQA
jgi:hypothetical protein